MTKENKVQVIFIALITALCILGDSMLYVVLPTHWKEVGLTSLWEVGVLLSVNRFIRVPLNPIVSWLYQRLSHRKGIILAVILSAIATASYGMSGFWFLLLMRAIWGIAWTFLRLGAYFFIVNISGEENRGHYMGIYNGIFRLGSLVGMLVGGIIADNYGIKVVSLIFASTTLFALFLVHYSIYPSSSKVTPLATNTYKISIGWKDSKIIWMLLTGFFVTMLYQGAFTSTLSHLIDIRQTKQVASAVIIGSASLAGIFQAIRWGWEPWLAPWFGRKSDLWGRGPVLVIALFIASLLFASINTGVPFGLWIVIIFGVQLTATVLTTVVDAVAGDVASQTTGKASVMTVYSIVTDLGSAVGAVSAYLTASFLNVETFYWVAALILLVLSIKWAMTLRERKSNPI